MTPSPFLQTAHGVRVPSTPLINQPSRFPWELPIRFSAPTGPVDNLLLSLLQHRRSLAVSGTSGDALLGPFHPSLSMLVYPDTETTTSQAHPITRALSDIISNTHMRNLPERAACLYVMYHLIRWQISPQASTYDMLPEWHSPRASQLVTPHPIWIDQIPWGKLRDRIINNQSLYATDEFQQLYTANISVNWPYRPIDTIVFHGDEIRISPLFEKHIMNLSNWSLGTGFAQRYPELSSTCRFSGFSPEVGTDPGMGMGMGMGMGGISAHHQPQAQPQAQQQHHQQPQQQAYQI
jgi:hypothetical protein